MPKSLFALKREGSNTNAFEVLETAGVVSVKVANVAVLGTQQAAQANTAAATAATVVTTAVTTTTPFGYASAAQGDAVAVAINALITDVAALRTTQNALLAKLRTHGIIAT